MEKFIKSLTEDQLNILIIVLGSIIVIMLLGSIVYGIYKTKKRKNTQKIFINNLKVGDEGYFSSAYYINGVVTQINEDKISVDAVLNKNEFYPKGLD